MPSDRQRNQNEKRQREEANYAEVGGPGVEDCAAAPAGGGAEAARRAALMTLTQHISFILILI